MLVEPVLQHTPPGHAYDVSSVSPEAHVVLHVPMLEVHTAVEGLQQICPAVGQPYALSGTSLPVTHAGLQMPIPTGHVGAGPPEHPPAEQV